MDLLHQVMRLPYVHGLWSRYPRGSVPNKVKYGIYPYAHYAYGVYWSAMLAKRLGVPRITAIEFGVAGGRGLVALEEASTEIGAHLGIGIDVVGFDSGAGMPPPVDHRDLPHIWNVGFYQMDQEKLRARLRAAKLVLGDVRETTREWLLRGIESPIGFVALDLDYYSSTCAVLPLFEAPEATHLPRVHVYVDDLGCTDIGCMSRYVGAHAAIAEFNERHADRKLAPIEQIRLNRYRWEKWQDRMYAFHDFSHPRYNDLILPTGPRYRELPLDS